MSGQASSERLRELPQQRRMDGSYKNHRCKSLETREGKWWILENKRSSMLKNFSMTGTERPRGLKKRVPCSDLHFRRTISKVMVWLERVGAMQRRPAGMQQTHWKPEALGILRWERILEVLTRQNQERVVTTFGYCRWLEISCLTTWWLH